MKTVSVVWISRHPLNVQNIEILREAFGDEIAISQFSKTLTEDELPSIVEYFGRDAKYVVVLPPNLIQKLLDLGVEVYRFIVERRLNPDGTVVIVPVGLERVKEIRYITERVV